MTQFLPVICATLGLAKDRCLFRILSQGVGKTWWTPCLGEAFGARRGRPWMCELLSKRHLKMEKHRGAISVVFAVHQTTENPRAWVCGLMKLRIFWGRLHEAILQSQIDEALAASRICDSFGMRCRIHDDRGWTLDTLYGRFRVKAPRL